MEATGDGILIAGSADVDISGLGPQARVVAQAMKDHGVVLVDVEVAYSTDLDDATRTIERVAPVGDEDVLDPARNSEEPPKTGPAGMARWSDYLDWVRAERDAWLAAYSTNRDEGPPPP